MTVATSPSPASTEVFDPTEHVPLYVWTMLGSIAANLFSGNSDLLGFPIGPDRLLLATTLVLLAVDRRRPRLVWRPVYAVMIALVLWTAWSALSAGTLGDKDATYALLDRIVVPFTMFSVGALVFCTERRRDLLLRLMTVIGIYLGMTAIFEIVGPHSLVWPAYVMNPDLGILFGRARGPFLNAEADGMTMGISMFMAMALFARTRGPWRVLCVACTLLTTVGIILCLTRSVWTATVLAGVLTGVLIPSVRRRLPLIVAAVVAVIGGVLMAVPAAQSALSDRFTMVSSIYDRQNTNAAALRIINEFPITGIGWHRFLDVGTQWVRQADTYPVSNVHIEVHNVFLSRAAETGVPGAALWVLAVVLGPGYALYRMPRSGHHRTWALILLAAVCYWGTISMTSPNSYPLPNNLMWLIGGFASARFLLGPARSLTAGTSGDRLSAAAPAVV